MAFLNPFLLFGISAVSIPIIIHLLNKRKFERVVWAAMRFLRVSVEKNQRRIQIEDLLLLALRCLLLALLAFALARPAIKAVGAGRFFGQSAVTGVIILDNSYSMSATDGVQQRFDQAKRAANSILDTLPPGSSIAVILGSDVANPIIPLPTYDLNLVRQTVQNAKISDRTTDASSWFGAALEILKGATSLRKEIYVLTDGQLNGWEKLEDIHTQLEQVKSEVHTQIVLVGSRLDGDVGVNDLQLVTDLPVVDAPLVFSATVKNYGTESNADARNVRVSLRVDDDPTADETVIDLLKAGASKTVTLSAKLHSIGTHTVTVSVPIETDRLPADDSRTLAVRAVKDIQVLMVDGDQGAGGREASTATIRNYLVVVPPAEQDQYFLKVSTVSPSGLENLRLDEYSAIVLSNVTDLSQGALESFANYLRRGLGGLMVFPGSFSNVNFYNTELVGKYHFLPGALGMAHGSEDPNNDSVYFKLQGSNFTSEVTRMWSDPAAGSPATAKFWKAYELIPDPTSKPRSGDKAALTKDPYAADAGVPQVVLSFGKGVGDASLDGKPAIMERQWGQGRVFEFASTADRKWNTLPDKPNIYLPLIYKTLGVIVRRQDDALNIKVGDKFVYHPADELIGKDAVIYGPGQKLQAIDSRRIAMVNRLPEITFDAVDNAGEYEVRFPGGTSSVKFAAYPDDRESDLAELGEAETQRLSEVAAVTHWTPGDSLGAKIEKERVGTELWTMLAGIALAMATLETFLGHWFSRTK